MSASALARPGWRKVGYRWAVLMAFCAASGLLLGALGELHPQLDLWAHFRWQYGAALICACGMFALLRRRWELLATLPLAAWCMVSLSPVSRPQAGTGQAPLKLISVNLRASNRDLSALLQWLRSEQPQVLVLMELSDHHLAALAPLTADFRDQLLLPGGPFGIGVWTRLAQSELGSTELGEAGFPAITLRAGWSGHALRLIAAHPVPPLGARLQPLRARQIEDLEALVATEPEATVLAGDLNATPWSADFRRLVSWGLNPGSHWPTPTWSPSDGLGWALGLPIDHVLSGSGWHIVDRRIGPPVGSDHRPLLAILVPTEPELSD